MGAVERPEKGIDNKFRDRKGQDGKSKNKDREMSAEMGEIIETSGLEVRKTIMALLITRNILLPILVIQSDS